MLLSQLTSILQLFLLSFCAPITSSSRTKRQIVFEDDDDRSNRNPNADCITPNNEGGRCVRWTACPPLRRINNWNRLQPHVCGFAGSEPRVCCPLPDDDSEGRNSFTTPSTTRRPTRRPPTRRTTTTRRTTPPPRRTTLPPRRTTAPTRRTTPPPQDLRNGGVRPSFLPRECGKHEHVLTRVVGGKEAEPNSWPWMAVVYVEKRNGGMSPDCGAALVSSQHVVTAAHCVVSGRGSTTLNARQLSVRLGAHDLRNDGEPTAIDVRVDSVRRHEQFDPRTYKNDIAVLRLSNPITFTKAIAPVCLPFDSLRGEDLTGRTSFVTGFGTTSFNGESSDVLMEVGFDIHNQSLCRRAYERELNITEEYLCAGNLDGLKDSCQGDSGGPLVTVGKDGNLYLVGIVSFGKLCAQPGYPGVYTRVTRYLDWLENNLRN